MSSSSLNFSYLPTYVLCLSSSAGEQIDQSEHRQAYTWEPEREHKENKSEPFHQPIDG